MHIINLIPLIPIVSALAIYAIGHELTRRAEMREARVRKQKKGD